MPTVAELSERLDGQREAMKLFVTAHTTEKGLDFSSEDLIEFNKRNDEMTETGKSHDAMRQADVAAKAEADRRERDGRIGRPAFAGNAGAARVPRKSLGQHFVDSAAYSGRAGSMKAEVDISLKAADPLIMTDDATDAGWPPQVLRSGRLALSPQEQPQVVDLIPVVETVYTSYRYLQEDAYVSGAAETAEGGTYAESTFKLVDVDAPVRKIGAILPVTDEQTEDVVGLRDYIDARMGLQLRQRLDSQLVAGDGTGVNLKGFLAVTGINAPTLGGDTVVEGIFKAMTAIRVVGKAQASGIVLSPTTWQTIRLMKNTLGDFIWGHPSLPGPERIWGVPVVSSTFIDDVTVLAGDFIAHSLIATKRGVEFQVSNSHGTYFGEGKQAIRADFRLALACFRPSAFSALDLAH